MKVPLSWLNDYVDTKDIPIEELAQRMTLAGLEVEEIQIHRPGAARRRTPRLQDSPACPGTATRLVVAEILEVMPHPTPTAWCYAASTTAPANMWC